MLFILELDLLSLLIVILSAIGFQVTVGSKKWSFHFQTRIVKGELNFIGNYIL